MKKHKLSIFLLIFLFFIPHSSKSEENKSSLTVFCTNNKDGTGSCLTSSQDPVECLLIPGSVVECKDANKNELICVYVHAATAIVEISCEKPKTGINTNNSKNSFGSIKTNVKAVGSDQIESDELNELEGSSEPVLAPFDQPNLGDNIDSPFTDPF